MKTIIQKTSATIVFAAIVLVSYTTNAGAPEGEFESMESDLKWQIQEALYKEGYRDKNPKHNISAYLWDNRHLLKTMDIPQHREVDLVICVMTRNGITGFERFTNNEAYVHWCEKHVKEL